jgi:hypothetical protein
VQAVVPVEEIGCKLTINSAANKKVTVVVYNTVGQEIASVQKNLVIGNNSMQLDISKYTPGIYVVCTIIDGVKFNYQKLIVE